MNLRAARTGSWKLVIVVVAAITIAPLSRATSQDGEPPPTKDRPFLEVDLRKFGYERYRNRGTTWPIFVDFTDTQRLAVAWITPDDRATAAKTRSGIPIPSRLHILLLDAVTGQKQGLQDLATPSFPIRFLGVRDGKFLACTGNVLRLFSPNFSVLQERNDLPKGACAGYFWEVREVSPSRQTLLLSYPSGGDYRKTLFRLDTFTVVADWTEEFRMTELSDHWLARICGEPRQVCIRGIEQSWKSFQSTGLDPEKYPFPELRFVNDEMLVAMVGNKMAVVKVGGTSVFQTQLAKKESFGPLATSIGGQRFAVMENRERGLQSTSLDMYPFASNDRIVVYSIPDRRAIFVVKVKGRSPWTPWHGPVNQFALSPDGTLLAVVCDDILSVYRLPGR
jgi:hypothetical protein